MIFKKKDWRNKYKSGNKIKYKPTGKVRIIESIVYNKRLIKVFCNCDTVFIIHECTKDLYRILD